MDPQTISENLLYTTVRLTTKESTGTGFFFQFNISENQNVPIIITNKHVVNFNENEIVKFHLHTKDNKGKHDNIAIEAHTKWYFHESMDLCFSYAAPLFNELQEKHLKKVFYKVIEEKLIWDNSKLKDLSAIEDVVMVGYPNGLWDIKNNFPLFRKGITATHPAVDFNDKNIGAVDMACFPGSSGSPLVILNEHGFTDKKGISHIGGKRLILLGVLFSGPQFNAHGEIVVEDIPTQKRVLASTPIMLNLGYYIKSEEILSFKSKIIEDVNKQ